MTASTSEAAVDGLLKRCRLGIDRDQQELDLAKQRAKAAESKLRDSKTIERFLESVLQLERDGTYSSALRMIRSQSKIVALIAAREDDAAELVRHLERDLESRVTEVFLDLVRTFPKAAKDAGLPIDPSSRHPKYALADRLLEVEFDKKKLEARVTTPGPRRSSIGIDVDILVNYLKDEIARLKDRKFDAAEFSAKLRSAVAAASNSPNAVGSNGSVPIRSVIGELATDRAFAVDEFIVDLSLLARADHADTRIKLDHTRDSSQGVLLWRLEDRGYYGYIRVE